MGRKQVRSKEGNTETDQKLQMAEQKMGELVSAMATLGTEAAAAMTSVEIQQQRLTLQRLIAMVCLWFLPPKEPWIHGFKMTNLIHHILRNYTVKCSLFP